MQLLRSLQCPCKTTLFYHCGSWNVLKQEVFQVTPPTNYSIPAKRRTRTPSYQFAVVRHRCTSHISTSVPSYPALPYIDRNCPHNIISLAHLKLFMWSRGILYCFPLLLWKMSCSTLCAHCLHIRLFAVAIQANFWHLALQQAILSPHLYCFWYSNSADEEAYWSYCTSKRGTHITSSI